MIRFERLQIDCNDMLYIYDGAHAIGGHKVTHLVNVSRMLRARHFLFSCVHPAHQLLSK